MRLKFVRSVRSLSRLSTGDLQKLKSNFCLSISIVGRRRVRRRRVARPRGSSERAGDGGRRLLSPLRHVARTRAHERRRRRRRRI